MQKESFGRVEGGTEGCWQELSEQAVGDILKKEKKDSEESSEGETRVSLLVRRGGDIFSFLEVAGGEETGLKVSISGVKRLPQVRFLEAYCLFVFFWLIITLPCLLLIFEYLLICLGWIMKATYCLLKHNLAYMFTTVNLSMFCSYCENGHSCI